MAQLEKQLHDDADRLSDADKARLRAELEAANRELNDTRQELTESHAKWKLQEATLQQTKSFLETRAKAMTDAINNLVTQLEGLEERCGALSTENEQLRQLLQQRPQPSEPQGDEKTYTFVSHPHLLDRSDSMRTHRSSGADKFKRVDSAREFSQDDATHSRRRTRSNSKPRWMF